MSVEPTPAAVCGLPLVDAVQARVGPSRPGAPAVVQIEGPTAHFVLDNRDASEAVRCTFEIRGASVRPDGVFFGFEALGAPPGKVEAIAPGRVRVTYPILGGAYGLVSVEPPVRVVDDPYRFAWQGLTATVAGGALLGFDGGTPRVRSLGPETIVTIHNPGPGPARAVVLVDNTSPRLSKPSADGLARAQVERVAPLEVRFSGEVSSGNRATLRLAPEELGSEVTFIFGGDIRGKVELFRRLVAEARRQHDPSFIVTSGDYTDNALPGELARYLVGMAGLDLPVYPVVGNHELHAQGARHYARRFGPRRYALTVGDLVLVLLDSNEPGPGGFRLGAEQLAWADGVLAEHRSMRHKLLALHAPPQPIHHPSSWAFYPSNLSSGDATRLMDLSAKHGVAYVLSGHVHLYARGEQRGTVYLTSGGGGARLQQDAEMPGFTIVKEHHVVVLRATARGIEDFRVSLSATP
ncbi:MAG: metallophosphoesterase [Deltaproteobacteria bacterium]|nr:metallophosphoesterase [Deltaproteobacteria bacterium]MBW2537185.1 metallophosphoesterase [Deltaproteobacteria bacterium]